MRKAHRPRLTLSKETLRQLDDREIRDARGGNNELTYTCAPSVSMPGCICLNTNVSCCC